MIELYDHQVEAVKSLKNGSILCGGVGTGKSRTALAYYYLVDCKGKLKVNGKGNFSPMEEPRDLYIITTAKKRDSLEWLQECSPFCIGENAETNVNGVKLVIDSWNNIRKYSNVYGAFFIFDEQRVVGSGAWVKAFLKIVLKNHWILLSATPGDTWSDYIPVFIANGFYKNKTEFLRRHAVFSRFSKYPKIDRFVETGLLIKHRNEILVNMYFDKPTVPHQITMPALYDKQLYLKVSRDRWDPYDNEPIQETGKLCYLMRKVVNSDPSRVSIVNQLMDEHERVIIFYNYDYELDILRKICESRKTRYAEWNGQKHENVLKCKKWAYLVQYSAGAEGWNCIETNVIIFYSQNYSYRMTVQAAGRIDRLNTKYVDLYYYHIKSPAPIDIAIYKALKCKKNFNERSFIGK